MRAFNDGDRVWGAGREARPEVRIAYRWHGAATDERALRTPFPADLAPGESQVVPVHVVPPDRPGRYRLELDLVHEHVRWFGAGFELDVEVVPRRRVALIGAGAALEEELDRLQLEPELEPVLVDRGETTAPAAAWEHPRIPGARDYLLHGLETAPRARLLPALAARTEALVRRARRPGTPARARRGWLACRACGLRAARRRRTRTGPPASRSRASCGGSRRRFAPRARSACRSSSARARCREPARRLDRALVADVGRHAR